MRIIHIISGDLWAGAEVQIYNTLVALSKEKDIEILCVVFNKALLYENLTQMCIRCAIIDETTISTPMMLMHLLKIIHEFKPNLIHAHRNKEHFLAACAALLSHRKIPVVRTVHGLSTRPNSRSLLKRLRSIIVLKIDTILIKYITQATIAVSIDLKEHLSPVHLKGTLTVINNSVDIHNICGQSLIQEPRQKYDVGVNFWIGTAVRFVGVKNIPMLIRSGKRLLQNGLPFRISIFGSGPLEKEYNSLIGYLNLQKRVFIHPFEEKILPVIRSLNVFVLCSHHEGMPMSLLEAMALEKPVICTAVGGMKEIIQNGINGLLVPDNDHDALANALERLFKEKDFALKLGSNAGLTVKHSYSVTQTTHQLISLYTSLIQ